ncbi:MAG: hypothetical protein PHI02_09250 [Sulfurovaceae bacterium]|nr:hypothetical protein [Sulfurovaceae bacterium]MDD5360437.1 hypothetical protein [Sulfurovaceae bacterium]
MKSIIILICLATNIFAYDIDPNNLHERDLKIIENIDSSLYNLATENITTSNIGKIYSFIIAHKNRKYTTNPIVIKANAKYYNKSIDYYDATNDSKYTRYGIDATLIILDTKQKQEIQNKIIDDDDEVLKTLEIYQNDLAMYDAKQKQFKYKNIVEIRAKAQEKSGIIYKDDRIKVIDEIMTTRNEMKILKDKIELDKLKILNFVEPNSRKILLGMIE